MGAAVAVRAIGVTSASQHARPPRGYHLPGRTPTRPAAPGRCSVTDDLNALAGAYDDYDQRVFPTFAHIQGEYRFADRFEDVSRAAELRDIDEAREFARRARAIPDADLGAQDRITREMIIW